MKVWERKRLEDLCEELFAGGDVPKDKLSYEFSKEFHVPIFANGERNKGLYGYTNRARVTKPSITISARGTIGYSEIRKEPYYPVVRLIVLIPNSNLVDLAFLQYAIRQMDFKHTGTSIPQLTIPMIKDYLVPCPPLPEQKRIVAKLDTLFAHLDQLKARLEKIPTLLKQFRQAVLTQAVTGKLTEEWRKENHIGETGEQLLERIEKEITRDVKQRFPRGYNGIEYVIEYDQFDLPESWSLSVVDKIGIVHIGGTPSRSEPTYWSGDINWVSSGEVNNTRIKGTNEQITKLGLENSSVKILPKGTVLIAMIGEGKTRGQSSILDIKACTNQNVAAIVTNEEYFNSEFLWRFMLSSYEKNRGEGRGANQPALNGRKVGAINIPIPPLTEQKEIVRRVESLFAIADKIEASYKTLQEKIDQLPQAILSKAFRGELVKVEEEAVFEEVQLLAAETEAVYEKRKK